jgi:hypothetical protein
MSKATFVRELVGFQGDARLYQCEGGPLPEYVAVSAVLAAGEPETYIFEVDESGRVLDWGELTGSFQGDLNHAEALRRAGYEVFQ